MKYLFFDTETVFVKNVHPRIVSFGYVLTDDQFNEIAKEDIFIHPNEDEQLINNWQWKQEATKDKEGFKAFYHKIKDLLEDKDTIIVGHGAYSDVQHLSNECNRFHLEPIDFDFLDTKIISDEILDIDMPKKLKNLYDYLCKNKLQYQCHRSLDDACMTKDVFEALINISKKENIRVLDNEEFILNSLHCVYKKKNT